MFKGIEFRALRMLLASGLIATSAGVAANARQAFQPADNAAAARVQVAQNYGKIPLSFEANQGQAAKTVRFTSRGSGYSLFLTDSSAVLALTKADASDANSAQAMRNGLKPASVHQAAKADTRKTDVVRMELAGANRVMHVTGVDQLPGTTNYFIGSDPAQWHTGVPTYARVKYAGVYPGIDLVYYGNQRQLEYDFVVAPGADPRPIRLQFAGAKRLRLDTDGDLIVSAANGAIAFHKPVIYQVKDGQRQPVDGQFALLAKGAIGFRLGQYDHSKPLVIDPVLSYSTYLGGSLGESGAAITADSSGNAYVVGSTYSPNFPVSTSAFQSKSNGTATPSTNVFIAKVNPTGTALVYSTYLGGSGIPGYFTGDIGTGVAIDGTGNAYVTGYTYSTDFPTTKGAYLTSNPSTKTYHQSGFVTKFNSTGTALEYSTYLGGTAIDSGAGIAVDSAGDAYVVGSASSTDFPTTAGAFQTTNKALTTNGWYDAFVAKFNPEGSALLYSTYLGGSSFGATGFGIAIDGDGDAYVSGNSYSTDFPVTASAFQKVNPAAENAGITTVASNAYVAELNPAASGLMYASYLGGSTDEYGGPIAIDSAGNAYVTGQSWSNDFPVTGIAYQSINNAYANDGFNAFVAKINASGSALVYATYLGGSGLPPGSSNESGAGDAGEFIAVDNLGQAYVTGQATSADFPVTSGAYQTVNKGAANKNQTVIGANAFVTKFSTSGDSVLYSTFLGGSTQDFGYGIALDGLGGVYVSGGAYSTNFPVTTGAFQTTIGGDEDAFIAKLAIGGSSTTVTTTLASPTPGTTLTGPSATFKWTAGTGATSFALWLGSKGVGSNNIWGSGETTATSVTFGGLPTNGETIYARLFATVDGVLEHYDYTFTAVMGAVMTYPTPGSTLSGPYQTFEWSTPVGATAYDLWFGTTGVGSNNLWGSGSMTGSYLAFGGLPTNGGTIYVRLFTTLNGSLVYTDTTYTAVMGSTLTSPSPGSVLPSISATFQWTFTAGATYDLWLGTTGVGSNNLWGSGQTTNTSVTFNALPTNGQPVYARLFTYVNQALMYTDAVYTATTEAELTAPTNTTFTGASETFMWSTANTATHYSIWVGSTGPGSNNLGYTQGGTTNTSFTLNSLPTNGEMIYVRLWTNYSGGGLAHIDYIFKAFTAP